MKRELRQAQQELDSFLDPVKIQCAHEATVGTDKKSLQQQLLKLESITKVFFCIL